MGKMWNRGKMTVSGAPGTAAVTLNAASPGFLTFAQTGVANSDLVSYLAEDGAAWEYGVGTYSSTGPTLTRTTVIRSSAGLATAISLSAAATIALVPIAEDFNAMLRFDMAQSLTSGQKTQAQANLGLSASGVVQRGYAEYSALTKLTTLIPYDDTVPQITEGTEIMTVTLTPLSATNRFRARFQGTCSSDALYPHCTFAIFASNDTNAKITKKVVARSADWGGPSEFSAEVEWVTGTTSAVIISVRSGAYYSGGMWLNCTQGYREYGASQKSTLVVEEITP